MLSILRWLGTNSQAGSAIVRTFLGYTSLCHDVQVHLPQASSIAMIAYCVFFVCGSVGMLIINFTWFSQLIKKAQAMINRVNKGLPPSRDYETTAKES